jgi:septal ring factor EnvC (AmiA/AmiB activator)
VKHSLAVAILAFSVPLVAQSAGRASRTKALAARATGVHDGTVAVADAFTGRSGGRLGRTDETAGPAELDFELRIEGRPVNPLQWLRRN